MDKAEKLICTQIKDETHKVKTFFFICADQNMITYKPGQFITLELQINGALINRCYTISSAQGKSSAICITVKRLPQGLVSNWLHDHFNVGDQVSFLPPAGDFTWVDYQADKYLFLSAGVGITPLMSMTRAHLLTLNYVDIAFIHSAHTPDDIIFAAELANIAEHYPNIKIHFNCSDKGRRHDWSAATGRLSWQSLQKQAPDLREREIFACGPASYLQTIRDMLNQSEFDMRHYHEESFSFEALATKVESQSACADTGEFAIHLQKSQREIVCGSQQFILEAATNAGVRLASSCTQGVCGTCKTRLVSGRVEMQHKGGIRQREIDQGMILLCCSKPMTDLVIDQ